jgi:hypothetical protein
MTDDEALAEACHRWGGTAKALHSIGLARWRSRPYAVGCQERALFIIYGEGVSWEEAFQDADRRQTPPPSDPSPSPQPPDPS